MKILPKQSLIEAICIIFIASIVGFCVNTFHPKKVKITASRPPTEFAEDTIPSEALPDVGINLHNNEDPIEEPVFVTKEQILKLLKKNQALLLDARSQKEYQKNHIPEAANLPYDALIENKGILKTLPDGKWLVCYCDGPGCDTAELLAYELIFAGYKMIAVYRAGLEGWKNSGNSRTEKEARSNAN